MVEDVENVQQSPSKALESIELRGPVPSNKAQRFTLSKTA